MATIIPFPRQARRETTRWDRVSEALPDVLAEPRPWLGDRLARAAYGLLGVASRLTHGEVDADPARAAVDALLEYVREGHVTIDREGIHTAAG